jgi:hypothetical protein
MTQKVSRAWVLVVAAAALGGCASAIDGFAQSFGQPVVVSGNDKSPPDTTLQIPDYGFGARVLHVGDAAVTMPIRPTDRFFIVAAAEDPEGVKGVRIEGEAQLQCTNGHGIGELRIFGPILVSDVDGAGVGGSALTRRWFPMIIDPRDYPCTAGFTAESLTVTLHAVGTNFAGQETSTPSVTFVWNR